jgi:hypothetical protein
MVELLRHCDSAEQAKRVEKGEWPWSNYTANVGRPQPWGICHDIPSPVDMYLVAGQVH